jgi:hypothetical protein
MDLFLYFVNRKSHTDRCGYKLIFNVVFTENRADDLDFIFRNGLIDTKKINVKLFSVAAENVFDKSVIYRIMKNLFALFVDIADWSVDFYINDLAEKRIDKRTSLGQCHSVPLPLFVKF